MTDYLDKEIGELRKEIADDLCYKRRETSFRAHGRILSLGGVGLLLVILLLALFSGGRSKPAAEDLAPPIQARLSQLEERITRVEGMEAKIASLERRDRELEQSLGEMDRTGRTLSQRVDNLGHVVDRLQHRIPSRTGKSEVPPAIKRMPFSLPQGTYHEVRAGESLNSIAQQYRLSVEELCRLNHISLSQAFHPCQELLAAAGSHQNRK